MQLSNIFWSTAFISAAILKVISLPSPVSAASFVLNTTDENKLGISLTSIFDLRSVEFIPSDEEPPKDPIDPHPINFGTHPIILPGFSESLTLKNGDSESIVGWSGYSGGLEHIYYQRYTDSTRYHGYYKQDAALKIQPSLKNGGIIRSIEFSPFIWHSASNVTYYDPNKGKHVDLVPHVYNQHENGFWLSELNYKLNIESPKRFKNSNLENVMTLDIAKVSDFLGKDNKPLTLSFGSPKGQLKLTLSSRDPITNKDIKIKTLAEAMGLKYLTWASTIEKAEVDGNKIIYYTLKDNIAQAEKTVGKAKVQAGYFENVFVQDLLYEGNSAGYDALKELLLNIWSDTGKPFFPSLADPQLKEVLLTLSESELNINEEIELLRSAIDPSSSYNLWPDIFQEGPLWDPLPTKNGQERALVGIAKDKSEAFSYYEIVNPPLPVDEYPFYHYLQLIEEDNNKTEMVFSDLPRMCANGSAKFNTRLVGVDHGNNLVTLPDDLRRGAEWEIEFRNQNNCIGEKLSTYTKYATYELGGSSTGSGVITYLKALAPGSSEVIIDARNGIGLEYLPEDFEIIVNNSNDAYGFLDGSGNSGEPTPVPTPALLPGLIGMATAALRKHKQQETEDKA